MFNYLSDSRLHINKYSWGDCDYQNFPALNMDMNYIIRQNFALGKCMKDHNLAPRKCINDHDFSLGNQCSGREPVDDTYVY